MTLSLATLKRAGLTPDWRTVYVGWQGFKDQWEMMRLPAPEVQQFAADSLTGDANADYLPVRVLDAASLDWEEFALQVLAARSGVDDRTARRKWRFAVARAVPLELPLLNPEQEDPYSDRLYHWCSEWWYFRECWHQLVPDNPIPVVEFGKPYADTAARLRVWLAEEEAALSAHPPDPR